MIFFKLSDRLAPNLNFNLWIFVDRVPPVGLWLFNRQVDRLVAKSVENGRVTWRESESPRWDFGWWNATRRSTVGLTRPQFNYSRQVILISSNFRVGRPSRPGRNNCRKAAAAKNRNFFKMFLKFLKIFYSTSPTPSCHLICSSFRLFLNDFF